jgi:hypothetical protein
VACGLLDNQENLREESEVREVELVDPTLILRTDTGTLSHAAVINK